jgi:transcriptional regulator with XRE-family HTH domain
MPHPIGLSPNGTFIRAKRQELGRAAGEFAKSVRVSYSHLANIENGHNRASVVVLARIARELSTPEQKVQIEDLIATGDTESSDAA